jgi:uncharacterized protein YdhG (YjbR/CyaY superfamily)
LAAGRNLTTVADVNVNFKNIDEYIAGFPPDVRARLQQVRQTIHKAAPEATERISYQMPCFALHGNLVYFAAFKNHIGFYPGGGVIEAFQDDLTGYKTAKGTVQFPADKPLPLDLIARIVEYRVKMNAEKAGK